MSVEKALKDQTKRQDLLDAIKASGGLEASQLGGNLFIYCGSNAVVVEADIVKEAIRTGHAIIKNGIREFYEWEAVVDFEKSGSHRYTWDKSGCRVKCNLLRKVIEKDGTLTTSVVKRAFRSFVSL